VLAGISSLSNPPQCFSSYFYNVVFSERKSPDGLQRIK